MDSLTPSRLSARLTEITHRHIIYYCQVVVICGIVITCLLNLSLSNDKECTYSTLFGRVYRLLASSSETQETMTHFYLTLPSNSSHISFPTTRCPSLLRNCLQRSN